MDLKTFIQNKVTALQVLEVMAFGYLDELLEWVSNALDDPTTRTRYLLTACENRTHTQKRIFHILYDKNTNTNNKGIKPTLTTCSAYGGAHPSIFSICTKAIIIYSCYVTFIAEWQVSHANCDERLFPNSLHKTRDLSDKGGRLEWKIDNERKFDCRRTCRKNRVTLIGNYYLCSHIAQTVVGDATDRTFSRKAKLVEILVDWGRGGGEDFLFASIRKFCK